MRAHFNFVSFSPGAGSKNMGICPIRSQSNLRVFENPAEPAAAHCRFNPEDVNAQKEILKQSIKVKLGLLYSPTSSLQPPRRAWLYPSTTTRPLVAQSWPCALENGSASFQSTWKPSQPFTSTHIFTMTDAVKSRLLIFSHQRWWFHDGEIHNHRPWQLHSHQLHR